MVQGVGFCALHQHLPGRGMSPPGQARRGCDECQYAWCLVLVAVTKRALRATASPDPTKSIRSVGLCLPFCQSTGISWSSFPERLCCVPTASNAHSGQP